MIQVSDTFTELIDSLPSNLLLTLFDGTVVPSKAVKSAEWSGGSNSGDDITLGSTVATKLTVELDRNELGGVDIADARLQAVLSMESEGETMQIPWGVLQVDDDKSDDDSVTISASDAMLWAFNVPYALDDETCGFDWETGVDGELLLRTICAACGVTLRTTGLRPIVISNLSPVGYTYREVIAFLSCMWGCFARIDGEGQLVLQWYTQVDRPIAANRYYDGGLVKADYSYTVEYIKCYSEMLEETLEVGDTTKSQGIYIKCPWMTLECLQAVWETVGGFSYRPVSELHFLGDPRLEPGDLIQVTDLDGTTYSVPCMTLHHEFDGGLISEVIAVGKSVRASDQDHQGPVTRLIERAKTEIKATLAKTEKGIRAEVSAIDGRVTEVEQTAGQVSVEVTDETGTLTTLINNDAWKAWFTDAEGVEKSGLHFDFEKGRFVFNGTGQFGGVNDGDTYIAVDGQELCLFDQKGEAILRHGVKKLNDFLQYPYIRMTTWYSEQTSIVTSVNADGYIIRTPIGFWVGNDAIGVGAADDPEGDYISVLGLRLYEESAGIFVDMMGHEVYVIQGKAYKNLYTGDTIARFG